ncbi:MAG: hypothetical protein IJT94_15640 [Oscillibacter sp.]|nr:hypothetical protein [Oscillibacter sp.]
MTEIIAENYKEKVRPLSVSDLLFVENATNRKLTRYGVRTIGVLPFTGPETLRSWLSVNSVML